MSTGLWKLGAVGSTPTSQIHNFKRIKDNGMKKQLNPPKPPKPPLCRMIREHGVVFGFCLNCGSSLKRTKLFFGKKKCINPECENSISE